MKVQNTVVDDERYGSWIRSHTTAIYYSNNYTEPNTPEKTCKEVGCGLYCRSIYDVITGVGVKEY